MSAPPTPPDGLDAVLSLADECARRLSEMVQAQEEYLGRFRRAEGELRSQLGQLRGLVSGLFGHPPGPIPPPEAYEPEIPIAEEVGRAEVPPGTARDRPEPDSTTTGSQAGEPGDGRQPNPAEDGPVQPYASPAQTGATATTKPNPDAVRDLMCQKYPAFDKLYKAGGQAKRLQTSAQGRLGDSLRSALDTVISVAQHVGRKISEQVENYEVAERVLREQVERLMNPLQAIDGQLAQSPEQAGNERGLLQSVRQSLWVFVQEATNREFRELAPPANEKLQEWLRKQGYRLPLSDYVESQTISHASVPRDHVVKTVRPGYVQMSPDGKVAQVTTKAVIQVSSGPAQISTGAAS